MPLDKQLIQFATVMQSIGEYMFTRGTVLDTVAWSSDGKDDRIAWVVNPLKALNNFGLTADSEERIDARRFALLARRGFGLKETGFEYEQRVAISEFLDRISGILMGAVIERVGDYSMNFTLITSPGWPWPAHDDQYFSVKNKGMMPALKPDYLLRLPADENKGLKERWGIDFCKVLPPAEKLAEGRAVVGDFASGASMMVTHCMRFLNDEKARIEGESIRSCGGFLFASLAVGSTPATNFGPCVLISYLDVVLLALKPYKFRKRGSWPIVVYDTDTWTPTMGTFRTDAAEVLFDQLHGNGDWMTYFEMHPWILGPPVEVRAAPFSPEGLYPTIITTTKKLASTIKIRNKKWRRGLESDKFDKLLKDVESGKSRYPYLEAKSNEVLAMTNFPLAICTHELEVRYRIFLEAAGFTGKLVTIPDQFGINDLEPRDFGDNFINRRWIEYEYAQDVAEKVREISEVVLLHEV